MFILNWVLQRVSGARAPDRTPGVIGQRAVEAQGAFCASRPSRGSESRGTWGDPSAWEPSDSGPDRRVYELTAAGHAAAANSASNLADIRDGLAAALAEFVVSADPRVGDTAGP